MQADPNMNDTKTKERRRNSEQRQVVENGLSIAHHSVISGVEYLLSRDIDPQIVKRVLLESLTERLSDVAA